jgi:modulator of FtsH protease
MINGNDPAAWQNFFIMIGSANAAITGLLFVALSMHLNEILKHPVFRPRAVLVLTVLTSQIVISAIVLAPQPRVWMGVEIMLVNLIFLAVNVRNRGELKLSGGFVLTVAIRIAYPAVAVILIAGINGAFYLLAAMLLITIVRSLTNCWTLLTALDSEPA